jgi:hypothetical protein
MAVILARPYQATGLLPGHEAQCELAACAVRPEGKQIINGHYLRHEQMRPKRFYLASSRPQLIIRPG